MRESSKIIKGSPRASFLFLRSLFAIHSLPFCSNNLPDKICPLGKDEARDSRTYRALLQIDTTAGHETRAVDYLKKVIEAEGIPTQMFALNPNRANLVARINGNGFKRSLLIFAHTDVVGVQREKWPVDTFGAVMKDDHI